LPAAAQLGDGASKIHPGLEEGVQFTPRNDDKSRERARERERQRELVRQRVSKEREGVRSSASKEEAGSTIRPAPWTDRSVRRGHGDSASDFEIDDVASPFLLRDPSQEAERYRLQARANEFRREESDRACSKLRDQLASAEAKLYIVQNQKEKQDQQLAGVEERLQTLIKSRDTAVHDKILLERQTVRFRAEYDKLLKDDYFGENPIYSPAHFRRRFRMSRSLFEKILEDLVEANLSFEQKKDALGLVGFSPHQKLTSALRMLAYGTSADQLEDLTRMAESTPLHNLKVFRNSIISRYGQEYL
jgi:hypothetical protein